MNRAVALSTITTLIACADALERPQWTVVIATNASVPQFGDRLLVELMDPSGALSCLGCRREFGVGAPEDWPVSFGVVPSKSGAEVLVRARLHRADHTGENGLPNGSALIDAIGRLPPIDAPVTVALSLSMNCFGIAGDVALSTTCDPNTSQLVPVPLVQELADAEPLPRSGDWPHAKPVPCEAEAPVGMLCIPGGAFLLGDPHYAAIGDTTFPIPERLVLLSPFALDADELTVGEIRHLLLDGTIEGAPATRGSDPKSVQGACTFLGTQLTSNDALPVNCAGYELAEATCRALGKRLPTEAEWEYAAGNLGAESRYPWGSDDDVCARAIVGRGRTPLEAYVAEDTACRVTESSEVLPWGPVAGGSSGDATALGVRNLGGNVIEWVADAFAPYTDACWSPSEQLLVDPQCARSSSATPGARSLRGSGWAMPVFLAKGFERNYSAELPSPIVGFRCATSM